MAAKLFIVSLVLFPLYFLFLYLVYRKRSSLSYAVKAFGLGIVSTLPLLLVHEFHLIEVSRLHYSIGIILTTLLFAVIEEVCKESAERFHHTIHKKSKGNDPLVKWVGVGLGFAYLENVVYIASALEQGDVVSIAILRLVFGTLAHTSFTSLGGALSLGVSRSVLYELRGFLGASISHTFFNLFHQYHLTFLTVPLLAIAILIVCLMRQRYRAVTAHGDPRHGPPPKRRH